MNEFLPDFSLASAHANNYRKRIAPLTDTFQSRGCPLMRELTVLSYICPRNLSHLTRLDCKTQSRSSFSCNSIMSNSTSKRFKQTFSWQASREQQDGTGGMLVGLCQVWCDNWLPGRGCDIGRKYLGKWGDQFFHWNFDIVPPRAAPTSGQLSPWVFFFLEDTFDFLYQHSYSRRRNSNNCMAFAKFLMHFQSIRGLKFY